MPGEGARCLRLNDDIYRTRGQHAHESHCQRLWLDFLPKSYSNQKGYHQKEPNTSWPKEKKNKNKVTVDFQIWNAASDGDTSDEEAVFVAS